MSGWSLPQLLAGLHDGIEHRLATGRTTFSHAPTKGDASESVWLQLLETYLPKRYQVSKAHVVDSKGAFSDQIDIVIFDRQYSPLIFEFEGQTILPAESVYAVFEAKQSINAALVDYAGKKAATVRSLFRTTLPIPYAAGRYAPKELVPIVGGILALESDWSPALGDALRAALTALSPAQRLDLGCIAAHGTFCQSGDNLVISAGRKNATAFLLELIARLQELATVPMIDVRAYAQWLDR